jgi:hypothetical protein
MLRYEKMCIRMLSGRSINLTFEQDVELRKSSFDTLIGVQS